MGYVFRNYRHVVAQLTPSTQALCSPLVKEFGIEYSKKDSADITQLRTLAVTGAATAEDPAQVISPPEYVTGR